MGDKLKIKNIPSKNILNIFRLQLWYTDKHFNCRGIWITTKYSTWIYRIIPFNKFWFWFRPGRKSRR